MRSITSIWASPPFLSSVPGEMETDNQLIRAYISYLEKITENRETENIATVKSINLINDEMVF